MPGEPKPADRLCFSLLCRFGINQRSGSHERDNSPNGYRYDGRFMQRVFNGDIRSDMSNRSSNDHASHAGSRLKGDTGRMGPARDRYDLSATTLAAATPAILDIVAGARGSAATDLGDQYDLAVGAQRHGVGVL